MTPLQVTALVVLTVIEILFRLRIIRRLYTLERMAHPPIDLRPMVRLLIEQHDREKYARVHKSFAEGIQTATQQIKAARQNVP